MKIHFPLLGFNLSGGVRLIIRLANGMVKFGHQVRFTVPAYRARSFFDVDPGVEIVQLGTPKTSRLGYYRLLLDEAARWGDVLVASSTTTPFLLKRSIRRNRREIPLLYLAQGYDPIEQGDLFDGPRWRGILNRQIALRSYPLADYRVYISRGVADLVGLDKEPHVLRGGVDPEIYKPPPRETPRPVHDKFRIGLIGRFSKRKGTSDFFAAWEQLRDLHSNAEVQVWPTYNWRPPALPAGVGIYDVCSDEAMARFYQDLDLFVFPSLFEGLGLPPLEAMACGTPVVLTDCVGVRQYAEPETNCLMVPVSDPPALAREIRRAYLDPDLRARLIRGGLDTAHHCTWVTMVEDFQAAIRKIEINEGL
jgi:glycosyltransferase involved in cell wall biosynthesis